MGWTAFKKLVAPKVRESYLISWKAAQTEVCRMSTLGMKRGRTWVIIGRPCGSGPILRARGAVTSKKRISWIGFSGTGIGAEGMLPAEQSFNNDFFGCTVLPSIVDDRALSGQKLKASGTFLHCDKARPHLPSDKYDKADHITSC
jgi:hypothetical protein